MNATPYAHWLMFRRWLASGIVALGVAACSGGGTSIETVQARVVGRWIATRNDVKPQQVGEVCNFAADHSVTCSEPPNGQMATGTWSLVDDHTMLLSTVFVSITSAVTVTTSTLTLTDDQGQVTRYARDTPTQYRTSQS